MFPAENPVPASSASTGASRRSALANLAALFGADFDVLANVVPPNNVESGDADFPLLCGDADFALLRGDASLEMPRADFGIGIESGIAPSA